MAGSKAAKGIPVSGEAFACLRDGDVTAIPLGFEVVLLARPGLAFPPQFYAHWPDRPHMGRLAAAFRHNPAAIGQLRAFWDRNHLTNRSLLDEDLLHELAVAVETWRLDALVLPNVREGICALPAEAPRPQPLPGASPAGAAAATSGQEKPFHTWDLSDRLTYVLSKTLQEKLPNELLEVLKGFLTPEGLAGLVLFIGLEVASHAAGGVGFIADAALVALLWVMCGTAAFGGMLAFADFVQHTAGAKSRPDLDLAAKDLAQAAVLLGVAALAFLGARAKTRSVRGRSGGGPAAAETASSSGNARSGTAPREGANRAADTRAAADASASRFPPVPNAADQPPGPGWVWRGKQPVGGDKGAWFNPGTGETMHPDLNHPLPIGPHWDYIDPQGTQFRMFPDGRILPK